MGYHVVTTRGNTLYISYVKETYHLVKREEEKKSCFSSVCERKGRDETKVQRRNTVLTQ